MPKKQFATNFDEEILKQMKVIAVQINKPLNWIIERLMEDFILEYNNDIKKAIDKLN